MGEMKECKIQHDKINDNEIYNEDREISETVLIEQYKLAMDLYKHEDSLTWNKVHYYLIVTGVIFALGNWMPVCDDTMRMITGVSGFVISMLFLTTISNGFKFLEKRKNAARNIENKLFGIEDLASEPEKIPLRLKGILIFINPIRRTFGLKTKTVVQMFIVLVAIAWGFTFALAIL